VKSWGGLIHPEPKVAENNKIAIGQIDTEGGVAPRKANRPQEADSDEVLQRSRRGHIGNRCPVKKKHTEWSATKSITQLSNRTRNATGGLQTVTLPVSAGGERVASGTD